MKKVFTFLFFLVMGDNLIAQSSESYRNRNHKLNRQYTKKINSKKHQVAVYVKNEKTEDQNESQLKRNHKAKSSFNSDELVVKTNRIAFDELQHAKLRDQKSTFEGNNKKHGKRFINYLTMMLAFSLILVSQ